MDPKDTNLWHLIPPDTGSDGEYNIFCAAAAMHWQQQGINNWANIL